MKPLCVIGEGAWGTAIATVLAENGYTVKLWCHDKAVVESIQSTQCNVRYLSMIKLSKRIISTASLREAMHETEWIFEAIPVKFLRTVIDQAKEFASKDQKWVVLSKGIEQKTLFLPSHIIKEIIPFVDVAVLSGPSFARDVAIKQPTAIALAATSQATAKSLKNIIDSDYFKSCITDDLIGVQLGGALKNIVALVVGIAQGAGFGDNTRALIITQGLEEIKHVIKACGGKEETVYGLAGIGDLILTACSEQSRNVQVGKALGNGRQLSEILSESGMIPESINTLESMHELGNRYQLLLPVVNSVYGYIHNTISVHDMIKKIMNFLC